MKNTTLGDLTKGFNNNLNAIRLIAAFMVLFFHSFALLGLPYAMTRIIENTQWGTFGVYIFLFISGFLLTKSVENNNSIKYLWSRLLRIFPALIVLILGVVFIIGPWVTKLTLTEYYSNSATWTFLKTISIFYSSNSLPSVFVKNVTSAIDSPLWTIRYLFVFYIITLLLAITKILPKREIILGVFILSLVFSIFVVNPLTVFLTFSISTLIILFGFFSFGMVLYLYRDKIQIRLDIFLFIVILFSIASIFHGFSVTLAVIPVGYLILFFGYTPNINLRWLTKFGDFSYGFYIWAWPVQQTIINFDEKINPWLLFIFSGIITYCVAALSWHLIEKHMLKLKTISAFSK